MNYNNQNSNNHFATSDIFLASYLRLTGCQLLSIDRRDRKRIKFVFDGAAEEYAMKYFNGEGMVSASAFSRAISESRNLLFDVE